MGLFDVFNKEKREAAKKNQQELEHGIIEFTVIKKIQELLAKGNSLIELGRHQEGSDKFNEALSVAKRAIEKNPSHSGFKYILCSIYLEIGAYDVAEQYLQLLINEHTNDSNADLTQAYTRLGVIYWYHKKDIPNAIKCLTAALNFATPSNENIRPSAAIKAEPHIYLAQIYWEQGNSQKAVYHIKERLKVVPDCQMSQLLYSQIKNA